jgi:radical SAM superfamily enzyme YgiQ (UPF0313 family)
MESPDSKIRCLLVQPRFPPNTFWNYQAAVELVGAKTPNLPLSLITVAAILPQHWEFRLVDLNCRDLSEADWQWAQLVGVGGMLPQQPSTLTLIREGKRRGKFVVCGGSDPSSQADIYREADALVLDEGELTIPLWLESWRRGEPRGLFRSAEKPDMTTTPTPRYDLIDINDYNQMALQISRGCPLNCEFCDIIELFGRKPRIKSPEQVIRELEAIRRTGYTGAVDIVDDNFIGNKRYIKRHILPAMTRWNRIRLRPFFFATEASMNLADDEPLMKAMAMAGFRMVFTGIETPDPELLLLTQKTQNTMKPIQERIRKLLSHGLLPTAGFILGFDNEKKGMDEAMTRCIEDAPISMAMVGLLVALPNTQLTRRLLKEGRLLGFDGKIVGPDGARKAAAEVEGSVFEVADQTVAGLNFVTTRDRREILEEYRNVIRAVYSTDAYMGRVLRQVRLYKFRPLRIPRFWEVKRDLRGLVGLIRAMSRDQELRRPFWRNFWLALFMGPNSFDIAMRLMSMFLHFRKQRDYILAKTGQLQELPGRAPEALEVRSQASAG